MSDVEPLTLAQVRALVLNHAKPGLRLADAGTLAVAGVHRLQHLDGDPADLVTALLRDAAIAASLRAQLAAAPTRMLGHALKNAEAEADLVVPLGAAAARRRAD